MTYIEIPVERGAEVGVICDICYAPPHEDIICGDIAAPLRAMFRLEEEDLIVCGPCITREDI